MSRLRAVFDRLPDYDQLGMYGRLMVHAAALLTGVAITAVAWWIAGAR